MDNIDLTETHMQHFEVATGDHICLKHIRFLSSVYKAVCLSGQLKYMTTVDDCD